MHVTVRPWIPDDEAFLWDVLHLSIHVRPGEPPPDRSVLDDPAIAHYLTGFGSRPGDDAVVACSPDGSRIGAAFCRRFTSDDPAYGFVSADVPEVGMAVLPGHRGHGVGRAMLVELLERHPAMSLSVDLDNSVAHGLYRSLGFVEVGRDATTVTMLRSS